MKHFYPTIIALIMLISCNESPKQTETDLNEMNNKGKTAIAIHGGAGNLKKLNLTPAEEEEYKSKLNEALEVGHKLLSEGKSAVEAVEAAIKVLEDSPLFNAGKGSVFNHDGINEMDAAIMRGEDLKCGAVAGVRHIKNPISAALAVLNLSEHILLTGDGAEDFAQINGVELVDSSYFYTQHRWEQLQEAIKEDEVSLDHDGKKQSSTNDSDNQAGNYKFGTVGCVALDKNGNLAAATSTGGLTNKRYGRIGDTPLIGCGTYANNSTCAVSCTGRGEDFIRNTVAYDISARMEYLHLPLDSAVNDVIQKKLVATKGRGGCIAIDRNGKIALSFTTNGMYRGYIDTNGNRSVMIYK